MGAKTSVAESVLRYFIFPSEHRLECPSEYNEFTIKMLVSHHTSRKWIIKVGRTAEAECQKFLKVHGSYLAHFPREEAASRQVEVW